ncbi:hypothetical protein AAFF_G00321970 [Aldrovandia affinis]|uniref:Uncharacterized protein n=1 Tax=Aldrovandia affinis TaxID=143900 RepID=A0AAD7WQ13_9TELE|nr:hypothetical protein AAFF_G00321970 [Aldrovandia affinis]
MQKEIQQVVGLLMAQVRRGWQRGSRVMDGGLLVAVSAEPDTSSSERLKCTVAAAGWWCSGVTVAEIMQEVGKRLPSSVTLSSPADPEELSVFAETCGALHFLLSVQVEEGRQSVKAGFFKTEQFLHRLSLVHGQVEIHFILKVNKTVSKQIFRADSRFVFEGGRVLMDSALCLRCPLSLGPGPRCGRLHPVLGRAVPLLLPPELAETGLCGETSLLPLAALSPCLEQYPNRPARLAEIRISFTHHSRLESVAILWFCVAHGEGPMDFLCRLAGALSWEDFGLSGVRCAERQSKEGGLCSEAVYAVDRERSQMAETEQNPTTEQALTLFLFIQHSDPFHSQLSDYIASEEVLEQHLDRILLHNEERLRPALHSVLQSALMGSLKRIKARGKIMSSLPVILNSLSTVVTSSSSLDFRTACLDRMKIRDTRELAVRLHQTLQKVTEGRFLLSRKCDNNKPCPPASSGAEDVSDRTEAKARGEGEQEQTHAGLSHPNQEVIPAVPQTPTGQVSCSGKRPWAEEQDSCQAPLKQQPTRSPRRALCPLQHPQSPHGPLVHAGPPHGEEKEEDMLWLQEVSNMSDWEYESGEPISTWTTSL